MYQTNLDYDDMDDSYFNHIADVLLNKCYLRVNGKKYRFVEIEFYLRSKHHNDLYTHSDPDQLLMHSFYFHKFKTGTYRSGTFKGMDLTFGSAEKNTYFGILVRSIQNIQTGDVIEGPCNVVNRILEEYKCRSIMELTGGVNLDLFSNKRNFVVVMDKSLPQKNIYRGPRFGLSDKYPLFRNRPYRYVTDKDKIKKQKSTLVQVDLVYE